MSNFKLILEHLNEEEKRFQCCNQTTTEINEKTRRCEKCGAKWLKKESGWAKQYNPNNKRKLSKPDKDW